MPKKQDTGPSPTQLKGEDGLLETVVVDGVRINKIDHDEEEMGKAQPDKFSPLGGGGGGTGGAASGRRAKSKQDEDFDSMTVDELKEHLDKQGVEYTSEDRKDDLVKLAKKGK